MERLLLPDHNNTIGRQSQHARRLLETGIYGPQNVPQYCDARLQHLDISFWTQVPVLSGFAAGALSDWLQYHQVFECFFDPDRFVEDLVLKRQGHCSSLLVNATLYIACVSHGNQMAQISSTNH